MDGISRHRRSALQTIPLGRVLGIPVGVHPSWFTIFVLLTWVLAVGYYPAQSSGWTTVVYWIMGAGTGILLFVAVLLHELGHALVALHFQVPVRNITLFLFGGVAQIDREPPSAVADFWIAIAGPVVSFALAAVFGLLHAVLVGPVPLLALSRYLATMNGALALFNLVPGFPLDGGRLFRALVWALTRDLRRATFIAANLGRGVSFLLLVLGAWQIVAGRLSTGLWLVLIGWLLETAARGEVQRRKIQQLLAGHRASEAMCIDPIPVSAVTTLKQLDDQYTLGPEQCGFVIKRDEEEVGLLTVRQIEEVPPSEWERTHAARIMIPAAQMQSVRPDSELWTILQQMDREEIGQLPVIAAGQIRGMLSREGIMRFLRTLREKPYYSK
jgi:Zn-dependent protease